MEVSNELKECFRYFNVYDLENKIKELTEEERLILTICAIDHHDEDNPLSFNNFKYIKEEMDEILDFHDNSIETKKIKNLILKSDSSLNISDIDLPKVLTKQEVREIKIQDLI
jgi:hypothetical protein